MVSQRRLIALALVAAALLGTAIYGRARPHLVTDSDFALIELHTELAAQGELRVGPYSRFGWNHPGPLASYLQAPLYVAGGRNAASLFAVALLINVLAIVTIAWCAWRAGSGWLAAALTAACLVLAWRAPRLLASPWSGHLPILAGAAMVTLTAAVASGRARLLPLVITAGSLAAQTHLALVPMVGVLGTIAVAHSARTQGRRRILGISALVWLALWLPAIADAAVNRGGNAAALWTFFVTRGGAAHDFGASLAAWSHGLTGVLRAGFGLPWGGHLALRDGGWIVPCALAQVLLLLAAWALSRRARRAFDAALALCALAASLAGIWATSRIQGAFLDHEVLWLAAIGALNLAIIVSAFAHALAARSGDAPINRRAAAIACGALLAVVSVLGLLHLRDITSYEARRTTPRRIPLAHAAIRDYMTRTGASRLLVDMQDGAWSEGAGVVLRLYQDGVRVAVPESHRAMFTRTFRATGWEDARITISPRYGQHHEMQARPGNVTLLEADPVFVNAIRIAPR